MWTPSNTDEPATLIVRVKTRIQSADGAFDVVGQVPMAADELSDDAVAWTQPQDNPIGGELPDWTDALTELAFEEAPCTRRKTPALRASGGPGLRLNGVHASGIQLSLIAAWPHCSDKVLTSLTVVPTL